MSKTTPAPPTRNATGSQQSDQDTLLHALGQQLPAPEISPARILDPKLDRSLEESLVHVSDLLTCAAATAYESGDGLSGSKRALAFSTMHLVEMAKAELDRSLDRLPAR
ncbi:hypothetical protein NLK61_16365 [Pseudomonas fuscovaginae UPB0736]|uniref:DUF3077 domain-containing protein n=1 Tax=Pseudomonas asplenii TaxID=53407 RepID=A0A1H6MJ37_9PSED|nr:hypothetical protein [Pseudomonas fuscovaginae]UUQ62872.1 hypothetical protein NLK61_16365 [Pseudomonas fuscovaginae UPB0736]SEH99395.1 hypothetical protein SAMN05216581_1076 [Pseudomonas fuscovaginae]